MADDADDLEHARGVIRRHYYKDVLERVGVADGARWDDGVVVEEYDGRRWTVVDEYAG